MVTKYIFVTGGVVSSLGKGIASAAMGRILKSCGFSVSIQKLDPYLNVDPGTMNPFEHGEVYVLDDGAETDLDLGTYERFIDENLSRINNVTTGQVYWEVINRERRGDYLGQTIQIIPHVTDEIKRRIHLVAQKTGAEIVIAEVGGTVGDIEGQAFLEAIRQMRSDVGRDNVLYIHVTLLPALGATGELKTKPTQHSVRELRAAGISPDVILCRSDMEMTDALRNKISLFCDVDRHAVIPLPTVSSIYEVPLVLARAGLGRLITEKLALPDRASDLTAWENMVARIRQDKSKVRIGLVGKYVRLPDAYISVREALGHAALYHHLELELELIEADQLEKQDVNEVLKDLDGIVVPGGFGARGIEGKIKAARYAKEQQVPYLGLCLGMQVMVIEAARSKVGNDTPNSTEFDPQSPFPVIALMPEQRGISNLGGTMRLGAYPCHLKPGTKAAAAYGEQTVVHERHRHRFELNNDYRDLLRDAGLVFSGLSPNQWLVEIAERADHPWMVGTQFHPEFLSRPDKPHPLFREFMRAACRGEPMCSL